MKNNFLKALIIDEGDRFFINIKFLKNENEITKIGIYDINGRESKTLWECTNHKQKFEFFWDKKDNNGKEIKKGIYFIGIKVKGNLKLYFEDILFYGI